MRTIKFRAWDKKDERFLPIIEGHEYTFRQYEDELSLEYECTPEKNIVLMQFTGLLDNNGKEIYEGDIMKVLDRDWSDAEKDTKLYIVYWDIGGFKLVNQIGIEEKQKDSPNIYNKEWFETVIYKEYGRDKFEIIGNIYENPELLTTN